MFECVLDARAGIGEGAMWCAKTQRLWWVEILERRLHCFDPASGTDEVYEMPSFIGCLALRQQGGLVVALQEGFGLFDPNSGTLDMVPGFAPGKSGRRFNDGAVSPEGCLLATTMMAAPPFDASEEQLVILDTDQKVRPLEHGLCIGNGLAFSPDGGTLYLSDSHPARNCIWAYDWDGNAGEAHNRRLFFDACDIAGHPDGAVVDAEGGYWFAAAYGWSIIRLTPHGRIDQIVDVPVQKPTKLTFGGPRLDTLYLTSIGTNLEPGTERRQPHAGGVFAWKPGICGTPQHLFAG